MPKHPDQEFTAFIDRVVRRQRRARSRNRLAGEAWVDPPRLTKQKNYDAATEQWRAIGREARGM